MFSPEYLFLVSIYFISANQERADVRDVQETVLIFMLFVDAAHESSGGWEDLVDKDEDGFLGAELDALADNIDELAHGQICRDEVLLLVDSSDVRLLDLLADNLDDGMLAGHHPRDNQR